MSTPGQADHEVPPTGAAEFHEAMRHPFDSGLPAGTQVAYNHTRSDQEFNDEMEARDFGDALGAESNLAGLAHHEPSGGRVGMQAARELPTRAVMTTTLPDAKAREYTDEAADRRAEETTGSETQWKDFASGHESAQQQSPRRQRAAGIISRAFRAGPRQ